MKQFVVGLICCLVTASAVRGEVFTAEQLGIGAENIYTVSSFDSVDYVCTYDQEGALLWEVPFGSKVVSWKTKNDLFFVFSKHRNGRIYFLTCLESATGEVKWEKAIYAPTSIEETDGLANDLDE